MRHPPLIGPMIAAGLLTAATAHARFDERTGFVTFDEDEIGVGFEDASELATLGAYSLADFRGGELPEDQLAGALEQDPRGMMEGQRALMLGPSLGSLGVTFDAVGERLAGRRVEISLWYRPEGTDLYANVRYHAIPLGDLPEDSPEGSSTPGSMQLLPTGRSTDDGWREMSTGPIDFTLYGDVQIRSMGLLATNSLEGFVYGFSSNTDGSVLVDGLAIRDLGPILGSGEVCTRATEAEACVEAGTTCFLGRCVDAAPVLGTVPAKGPIRSEYLARLVARNRLMMGSRYAATTFDDFERRLTAAAEAEVPEYWALVSRAYDNLADGHASMPARTQRYTIRSGVCMYLGEADLLPEPGLKPLIFEVAQDHPLGQVLRRGDAVVAIDGVPVDEFQTLVDDDLPYGGDPQARKVMTARYLLPTAYRGGSTITFERCEGDAPCTEETVERFDVDLAAITAPLWSGDVLPWRFNGPQCDFRFYRGFDLPEAARGSFVGHREDDGISTLYLNGVSGQGRWVQLANDALTAMGDRVILDQRQGNGGTFQGVNMILEPFLDPALTFWAHIVPQLTPEMTEADRAKLLECESSSGFFGICGGFFSQEIGGRGASRGAHIDTKLAIVNGMDVSGNDYLPRALQLFRDPAKTRIFGPANTYGAFGPIYSLPRVFHEVYGGSFQLHDTQFIGDDGTDYGFETGYGVVPDEVIYQRQSDLLAGVDTILARARAWLLEEE